MKKQIHHILSKTPLLMRVVSLYVVAGTAVWFFMSPSPEVSAAYASVDAAVGSPAESTKLELLSGRPIRIELPRIGLMRDIVNGNYDTATQQWTLTDDKAQYATMTVPLNNASGQTMIYGHNTSAVLEPVRQVAPGDALLAAADNGRTFVYTYSHDRVVDPTDISVLQENPETPRVVLMTCEGWLSATRRLLYFDFMEVR